MSASFSSLGNCFWWLLLGVLVGWLAHYCLRKCCSAKSAQNVSPQTAPPPAAKMADAPTAAVVESVTKPKAATKPKATAKPKAATKSKAVAKPKTAAKPKAPPVKKTSIKK